MSIVPIAGPPGSSNRGKSDDASPSHVRDVVQRIESYIADYITFTDPNYVLPVALWALGTHCFEEFNAYPCLSLTSDMPGAGKSDLLGLLTNICHKAEFVSKITRPVLCWLAEFDKATILFDQAEKLSNSDRDDLLSCILAGYKRGGTTIVMDRGVPSRKRVYCPKAFALIGPLGNTLRDRCIVIQMERRRTRRILGQEQGEVQRRGKTLLHRCGEAVALQHEPICAVVASPPFRGLRELFPNGGRPQETWEPLFALAEVFCPKRLDELVRVAADLTAAKRAESHKVKPAEAQRRAETVEDSDRLLRDALAVWGTTRNTHSATLLKSLKAIPTAPWRNYAGVGLTAEKLAELLRPFGVCPENVKVGQLQGKGYKRRLLELALIKVTS